MRTGIERAESCRGAGGIEPGDRVIVGNLGSLSVGDKRQAQAGRIGRVFYR